MAPIRSGPFACTPRMFGSWRVKVPSQPGHGIDGAILETRLGSTGTVAGSEDGEAETETCRAAKPLWRRLSVGRLEFKMAKASMHEEARSRVATREYTFTVVFEPVDEQPPSENRGKARNKIRSLRNSTGAGYQVTVPLLPGLITYGRTLSEAREMARDAIVATWKGCGKRGNAFQRKRVRAEKDFASP
jgi:predicted RNase H-like HicB family nuclease